MCATSSKKRFGTTSACAENTDCLMRFAYGFWNYLRVRGEYVSQAKSCVSFWELPPRARRILQIKHIDLGKMWNYLRVRGEYPKNIARPDDEEELPPRARRIRQR